MITNPVAFRRATAEDLQAIVGLLADDPIGRGRENPGPQLDACYHDAFAAIERDPNQLLAIAERHRVEELITVDTRHFSTVRHPHRMSVTQV